MFREAKGLAKPRDGGCDVLIDDVGKKDICRHRAIVNHASCYNDSGAKNIGASRPLSLRRPCRINALGQLAQEFRAGMRVRAQPVPIVTAHVKICEISTTVEM